MTILSSAFFVVVNVSLVYAASQAAFWLMNHHVWPFQEGFWNVVYISLHPPKWLYHVMTAPAFLAGSMVLAVLIGMAGVLLAKWKKQSTLAIQAGLLSFVLLGFPSLWLLGSFLIEDYEISVE